MIVNTFRLFLSQALNLIGNPVGLLGQTLTDQETLKETLKGTLTIQQTSMLWQA